MRISEQAAQDCGYDLIRYQGLLTQLGNNHQLVGYTAHSIVYAEVIVAWCFRARLTGTTNFSRSLAYR